MYDRLHNFNNYWLETDWRQIHSSRSANNLWLLIIGNKYKKQKIEKAINNAELITDKWQESMCISCKSSS